ncbi:putative ABC transporter ATP-binding protein, partial [Lacticaseibacillus paracasei subsp. paracasei Lpp41]
MADQKKSETTKQPSGPRMGPGGRAGLVEKPKN